MASALTAAVLAGSLLVGGGRWLALRNLGHLLRRGLVASSAAAGTPRVSVCVPARDEEAVIGRLIASLRRQSYPALEIVVVDDHSTDGTAAIAAAHAEEDPRVRLLSAPPLPDGWLGKNHALHTASMAATGELLLFVDADTVHHPDAVADAVTHLGASDVLVVLSGQELGSWAEKVVSPFFWSLVLPAVDAAAAEDPARPDEAMGNGQFALFRASVYRAAGGHEAVRDVVVEDVSLVRRLKRAGASYRLAVAPDRTRTRMYRSFAEVWRGFSKNVAVVRPEHRIADTALTASLIALVAVAELGPFAAFACGGWGWLTGALHLTALLWMRSAILRRMGRVPSDAWPGQPVSWGWALLQPVGAVLGLAIFVNALRLQGSRGARWKGRALAASRPL